MNKVFIENKVINFVSNKHVFIENEIVFYEKELKNIQYICNIIENDKCNKVFYIVSDNKDKLFKLFCKKIKNILAAGGIVINENNDILFIFRRGYWDFPKGKIEKGEKEKEAAIREVKEETGLQNIELGKKIGETNHLYKVENNWVLKRSQWYFMKSNDTILLPQYEEGITDVKWIKSTILSEMRKKTYFSLIDLIDHLMGIL